VYTIAGGEKDLMYMEPASDTTKYVAQNEIPPGDLLYKKLRNENPYAEIIEVHIPETKASPIEVSINPSSETYWETDYRFFDQYTMEELSVSHIYGKLEEAKTADKLLRMNYDIHTGAIIGLPGKILAFFASLIVASLPFTGFYIWWGRRKKNRIESKLQQIKPLEVEDNCSFAVTQLK
jgi:uncharacterized iron-regulated membrane protein